MGAGDFLSVWDGWGQSPGGAPQPAPEFRTRNRASEAHTAAGGATHAAGDGDTTAVDLTELRQAAQPGRKRNGGSDGDPLREAMRESRELAAGGVRQSW
jgi:hypothetical protein